MIQLTMRRMVRRLRLGSAVLVLAAAGCQGSPSAPGVDRDLFVVRHAEAWLNLAVEQRGGRSEQESDALTPRGVEQAEVVAGALQDRGLSVVFHSPRGRARETAQILARGSGARVVELDALRPMDADETKPAAALRVLTALLQQREMEPGNWAVVSHSGLTEALLTAAGSGDEGVLPTGGMRQVRWFADGAVGPRQ